MHIRSRMGVSADGFVATPEGVPTLAVMPGFVPGTSHGFPEFIQGCDAVVMGRNTFVPALGAPRWPWPGLQVYVLTSSSSSCPSCWATACRCLRGRPRPYRCGCCGRTGYFLTVRPSSSTFQGNDGIR